MIDVAKKSLLGKALARPDWVKQVLDKVRTEGIGEAWRQSFARLDMPVPLGYASHAEVVSVPRNLCVELPSPVCGRGAGGEGLV